MSECPSAVEDYSCGVGSFYSLWTASFPESIGTRSAFSDGHQGSASSVTLITCEYELMNETRLLWKSRFFYTIDGQRDGKMMDKEEEKP